MGMTRKWLLGLALMALLLLLGSEAASQQQAKNHVKEDASSSSSSETQGIPKSERDNDPTIIKVRTLRNEALQLKDKSQIQTSIEKLRQAILLMHSRVFGKERDNITDQKDRAQDASLYSQLLNDYGNALVRDNQLDEALEVLKDAAKMAKKIYGPTHPSYGISIRNLAEAYTAKKQHAKAARMYKKLLFHLKKGLGATHEAAIETAIKIGQTYGKLGQLQKELEAYNEILQDQGDEVNVATHGIAELFIHISVVKTKLGQTEEALSAATMARDILKQREGDKSIDYAFALNAIAGVYVEQKLYDQAVEMLEEAHHIAFIVYGKTHPLVEAGGKNIEDVKELARRQREREQEKKKNKKKKVERIDKVEDTDTASSEPSPAQEKAESVKEEL